MSDVLVVGTEELAKKFHALETGLQGALLVNVVRAGGNVIVNAAKDNIKKQGLIRTRSLSRSIHLEVSEQSATKAAVDVGTNLEYAAIHEFGGTIVARKSKYLSIPVGTYVGSPRTHDDLKLRKTAGGMLLMVDPAGTVQYLLKPSVEIPARPYLRPALDENEQKAQDTMADAFRKLIEQAVSK